MDDVTRQVVDDVITLCAEDSRQTSAGHQPPLRAHDTQPAWRPRIEYETADGCITVHKIHHE